MAPFFVYSPKNFEYLLFAPLEIFFKYSYKTMSSIVSSFLGINPA